MFSSKLCFLGPVLLPIIALQMGEEINLLGKKLGRFHWCGQLYPSSYFLLNSHLQISFLSTYILSEVVQEWSRVYIIAIDVKRLWFINTKLLYENYYGEEIYKNLKFKSYSKTQILKKQSSQNYWRLYITFRSQSKTKGFYIKI